MAFTNSFANQNTIDPYKSTFVLFQNIIHFRDHHHSSNDRTTDNSSPVVKGK